MHKLFGYGPDTFGILTTQKFFGDMIDTTGLLFDNAHNEYLQFTNYWTDRPDCLLDIYYIQLS